MNLRTITAVFGMALIMAVLAGPAGAATDYNLQNDWNNISNPNGPWETEVQMCCLHSQLGLLVRLPLHQVMFG